MCAMDKIVSISKNISPVVEDCAINNVKFQNRPSGSWGKLVVFQLIL